MHLYRDSSIAPLLDLKRKVLVGVLEDVILGGSTVATLLNSLPNNCILTTRSWDLFCASYLC